MDEELLRIETEPRPTGDRRRGFLPLTVVEPKLTVAGSRTSAFGDERTGDRERALGVTKTERKVLFENRRCPILEKEKSYLKIGLSWKPRVRPFEESASRRGARSELRR